MINLFSRLPKIFHKAAAFLFITGGALILQFVTSILIARLIGPEAFGAYTYAFVIATTVGIFLTLGLEQLLVRELPRFVANGDDGSARGFLLTMWITLGAVGLAAMFLFRLAEQENWLVLQPGWLLVGLLALAHALTLSLSSILTGLQYITTAQIFESVPRGILVLSGILALSALGQDLDPALLFKITIISAIPVLFVTFLYVRRATRKAFDDRSRSKFMLGIWYGAALPVAVSVLAQSLKNNTDIIMVGTMLGDFETGIYRAAARGAFLITFASLIAVRVLGPMLSGALAKDDMREAQNLLAYSALIAAGLGLPACLILGFGATFYLGLFGPEFVHASLAMDILVMGHGFQVLTAAVSITLILLHHERLVFAANLFGLLANIVLNYLLIGRMGIEGAAVATALTTVMVNGYLLYVLFKRANLDPTLIAAFRFIHNRVMKTPD